MIKAFASILAAIVLPGCIVTDEAGHIASQNCRALYGVSPPSDEYNRCHAYERRRISKQIGAANTATINDFQRAFDRYRAAGQPGAVAPAGSTIITPDGRVLQVPW